MSPTARAKKPAKIPELGGSYAQCSETKTDRQTAARRVASTVDIQGAIASRRSEEQAAHPLRGTDRDGGIGPAGLHPASDPRDWKEQDASATITAAHLVSRGASILWSEWPVLHTLQTEQDALREARDPDDGAWLDAWHYRAFEGAAILNKEGREEKFKLSRDEARPVKALIALGLTTNSAMALCLMAVLIAIPDRPDVNGAMRRELKRFRDAATARLSEAQTRRNARARERVTLVTSSLDDV